MGKRPDEGDRLRERQIRWLQREVLVWRALAVLGTLAAILGGPAAVQALQAVQGLAGVVP